MLLKLENIARFIKDAQERKIEEWKRRLNSYKDDTSYLLERRADYEYRIKLRKKIIEEYEEFIHFFEESKYSHTLNLVYTKLDTIINELRSAQREYKYYDDCVDTNARNIELAKKKLKEAEEKVKATPEDNELAKKIYTDLEIVSKMKQIKSIWYDYEKNYIMIDTRDLYINEPITGKRFKLGEATIIIRDHENLANNIRFHTNNKRYAYGGDWMHHPHIFPNGDACWGTAQNNLILAAERNDYISIVLTALLFLQTCDINDPAGKYVGAWDEVDMNNEIIHGGRGMLTLGKDGNYYDDEETAQCDICDCNVHPDDLVRCHNCDNYVCEDCRNEIQLWTEEWITVCDNCINDYYYQCADCGLFLHDSEGEEVGDAWVCPHCAEERRNNNVHPF